MIRTGVGAHYTIRRNPQNSMGNYKAPTNRRPKAMHENLLEVKENRTPKCGHHPKLDASAMEPRHSKVLLQDVAESTQMTPNRPQKKFLNPKPQNRQGRPPPIKTRHQSTHEDRSFWERFYDYKRPGPSGFRGFGFRILRQLP